MSRWDYMLPVELRRRGWVLRAAWEGRNLYCSREGPPAITKTGTFDDVVSEALRIEGENAGVTAVLMVLVELDPDIAKRIIYCDHAEEVLEYDFLALQDALAVAGVKG